MKYIIKHLDVNNIYILTRTEPTLIDKKNVCIQKEFPMFKREHILHVYKAEEKVLELEKLKNRYHKLPIFIADQRKKKGGSKIHATDEQQRQKVITGRLLYQHRTADAMHRQAKKEHRNAYCFSNASKNSFEQSGLFFFFHLLCASS